MQKDLRVPYDFKQDIDRSVHDLSVERRTTAHPCVNIPLWFKKVTANDSFEIDFSTLLQSSPLVAPLMGKFKLRTTLFFEPLSNLYGFLDNNQKRSTEDLLKENHHRWDIYTETFRRDAPVEPSFSDSYGYSFTQSAGSVSPFSNNFSVGRHSLFEYLGLPAGSVFLHHLTMEEGSFSSFITLSAYPQVGFADSPDYSISDDIGDGVISSFEQQFTNYYYNLDRVLTYLDIMRSYYVNRQEDNAVWQTDLPIAVGAGTEANVPLETLDSLFMELRSQLGGYTFTPIGMGPAGAGMQWFANEYLPKAFSGYFGGLFNTLYEPDYFSNMLSSDVGSISAKVSSNGTIHELYFANKLQKLIDRLDISGGVFSNWIRSVRGSRVSKRLDIPEIIGSVTHIIDPRNVTSVSNTYQDTVGSSLGQMAGVVNQFDRMWKDNKDGVYSFDYHAPEDGYLMAIVSIIPCVDYTQGIEPDVFKSYFVDDYTPQFQRLGFMQYNPLEFNALPARSEDSDGSPVYSGLIIPETEGEFITAQGIDTYSDTVGKHPAWMEMMTDVDRSFGEFSDGGMYQTWILRRPFYRLRADGSSYVDITRYQRPLDFQYPFVAHTHYDPNFFLQLGVQCRAVRPIIKSIMPSFN